MSWSHDCQLHIAHANNLYRISTRSDNCSKELCDYTFLHDTNFEVWKMADVSVEWLIHTVIQAL